MKHKYIFSTGAIGIVFMMIGQLSFAVNDTLVKEIVIDGWTIDGSIAGPAFRSLAGKVKTAVEQLPLETEFPISLNIDEQMILVEPSHVKRLQKTETLTGEWFIPHVVEPAFGIDRIIWHLLDHSYSETEN